MSRRSRRAAALVVAGAVAWPAFAQAPEPIEHVVADGDTLIALAQRYLLDANQWVAIQKANPAIRDVRRLQPGSTILIPGPHQPGPVATHVSGKARYARLGRIRELAKGDELRETDTVEVEPGSYVTLRWPEGIVTHLLPGVSLRLLPPPARKGPGKDTEPRPRTIDLHNGTIESAVPPGVSGRSYQVRTRLGTAAVRGTHFGVRLLAAGSMVTEVTEGTVQLAGTGFEPVDVPHGMGAVSDGSRRQPQAVAMLKAPQVEEGPVLTPESSFDAAPVEGAAGYEFELAPAADPQAVMRRQAGPAPSFALRPIRDGSYRTTIRAVDAQGIPGLVTTRTLTVMTLPAPFLNEPENDAKVAQDLPTRMLCTDIPGATHYEIDIRRPGAREEAVRFTVAGACDAKMPTLLVGAYEWRAYALRELPGGKVLRSGPSAAGRFTVMVRPPTPALKVGGGQGLNLMWEGSPDSSYIVQMAGDEEFKSIISETKVDLPEVTLQVPTGGSYYVRIRTLSGSMASDFTPPRIIRGPAFVGSSDGQAVRDSAGTPLGPQ